LTWRTEKSRGHRFGALLSWSLKRHDLSFLALEGLLVGRSLPLVTLTQAGFSPLDCQFHQVTTIP